MRIIRFMLSVIKDFIIKILEFMLSLVGIMVLLGLVLLTVSVLMIIPIGVLLLTQSPMCMILAFPMEMMILDIIGMKKSSETYRGFYNIVDYFKNKWSNT